MNEELFVDFLRKIFPASTDTVTGIGDDAAVLDLGLPGRELFLAAADQVISGVHFVPGTPVAAVAEKLLKRNLSDIAAMGGIPTHALLTVALNPADPEYLREFHAALAAAADFNRVSVIGGDVAALPAPGFAASLTILGRVEHERLCLRSNAEAGDLMYVTGEIGNSFASGWHLNFIPRLREARFLSGRFTSAMMDVSDGLYKDAARFAAASGLAFSMDTDAIPLRAGAKRETAGSDGEDYELLFAVHPALAGEMERSWPFPGVKLTRIGKFESGESGKFLNAPPCASNGYDHFHE